MKYQLFTYRHDEARSGIVVGAHWLDLGDVAEQAEFRDLVGCSVDDLLANWTDSHAQLRRLARLVDADPGAVAHHRLDAEGIELLSPQLQPGAIYGAGANYRDHVEAMSRAFNMNLVLDPKAQGIPPWHFLKSGRANLSAHRAKVPFPKQTQQLDWEAELAVVIGTRASDVSVERALEHVAGYMCANDLSARDYLVRQAVDATSPFRFDWIGHKCFTGSCPLGPVLTPAEFVGSPENLDIKLWLNGEIQQDSNTNNHLYSVAEQISYLSRRMELLPGDVILTGTPAGVGMERGVFLKPGDVVKVWIDGLGELETTLV
jgi:2-keto-4-pentenoate hydratase/2-oxohepta-3-ene-1,7-dioic acid hydratase in catechol pathway